MCNNPREDTHNLSPCQHEEADTRLLLHAKDATIQGHNKVIVRTVDTDVVVLVLGMIQQLDLDELWVAFGAGKHLRYISVHAISEALGSERCRALPAFHAFTGCDQTSAFTGKGTKTGNHGKYWTM
jgi:hypothetical protein